MSAAKKQSSSASSKKPASSKKKPSSTKKKVTKKTSAKKKETKVSKKPEKQEAVQVEVQEEQDTPLYHEVAFRDTESAGDLFEDADANDGGEASPDVAEEETVERKPVQIGSAASEGGPSLKLYRRIAITFVVIVALMLGVVVYLSSVNATIYITPVEDTLKTEFLLDVVQTPTQDSEVRGRIVSGSLGSTKSFTPTGEGTTEVEGVARGEVILRNTSSQSQPLVRTTRLLTPDGVLFRIDKSVTVPANGSVTVPAYADEEGVEGDIEPTTFTIPGLSTARQKEVYAESEETFTGGLRMVSALSQEEIDRAIDELKTELEEDGKAMLRDEVEGLFSGESFSSTVTKESVSTEAGEEIDSFDVTVNLKLVGVFFDKEAVERLAQVRLYEELGPGKEFLEINKEGLQATVDKVDVAEQTANVRVYLDGRAAAAQTSDVLNPEKFSGKNEAEVREMLISSGIAKEVEVDFAPFWVKKVPRLSDHVDIIIKQ